MGEDALVNAVETDDLQTVAAVLGTMQDDDEVTGKNALRALTAREYADDNNYPGIATYAEDVLASDEPLIDAYDVETAKAGGIGFFTGMLSLSIMAGDYLQDLPEDTVTRIFLVTGLATGGTFAYIRQRELQNEDSPATTDVSLADMDPLDKEVQDLQEHLYNSYDIDTYGRNEIAVPFQYR